MLVNEWVDGQNASSNERATEAIGTNDLIGDVKVGVGAYGTQRNRHELSENGGEEKHWKRDSGL